MSLIHEKSASGLLDNLELFSVGPSQTQVLSGDYELYSPLASLHNSSIVEFEIVNNHTEKFIDVANTFLHVSKERS